MNVIDLGGVTVEVDPRFQPATVVFLGAEHVGAAGKPSGYRPTFVLTTSAGPVAPERFEAYVRGEVDQLRALRGFRLVEQRETQTSSGARAFLHVQALQDDHGTALEQLQAYVLGDDRVWIGTVTHLTGEPFRQLQPDAERMLLSFAPATR